ncbi:PEBP-like protein [Leucogyrophana mollusca]|uniref:PEBP-like protein n=1 Tax=Leucogyrophana mollusca TaxID=85980 RepID=A0ACB8AZZ9_9AGAM|nr:PEBP-like protein [Leucogyrophana mollusca]
MPFLDPLSEVTDQVQKSGLAPDVIPAEPVFRPNILVAASWGTGDTPTEASLGNTLTKATAQHAPALAFTPTEAFPDAAATYTLAMVDPDAPSRADPRWGQWRHWLVTGVKPLAPGAVKFAAVDVPAVSPYIGPSPPEGSGAHRYAILLFKEPSAGFTLPADAAEHQDSMEGRAKWDAVRFAENYGMRLAAVNFFYVKG